VVVGAVQGHIAGVGVELRAVLAAELAELRVVPEMGVRATLPVEAALAIVAAEFVEAEAEGPGAVGTALARGEHCLCVGWVGWIGDVKMENAVRDKKDADVSVFDG
jgi:hypothetical protein